MFQNLIYPFIFLTIFILIFFAFTYTKYGRKKIYAFIFIGIFFCIAFCLALIGYNKKKEYHFVGIIENITYDAKQIPSIVVDHKVFHLSPKLGFKDIVAIGDSAIKHKGDTKVKFINKKTKMVTYIDL